MAEIRFHLERWYVLIETISVHIFILLFFIFPHDSFGQKMIVLADAFDLLEKQHPDMLQANFDRLLAKQDYKDAKNSLFPQISFGVSNNYNYGLAFDQIAGQLITGNKWSSTANANVNLRTDLFDGFSRLNSIRATKLNLEASNLSYVVRQKALEMQLLANYFDGLANMELHHASQEQFQLSVDQLAQTRTEFELGAKTLIDVSLIENQLANDELRVLQMLDNLNKSLLVIKEMLNIPLDDSIKVVLPDIQEDVFDKILDIKLEDSREIAFSRLQVRMSEQQLRSTRNLYFPTLSLASGYGTNYSSERRDYMSGGYMPFFNQIAQNRSIYIGFSLSVPILNGYRLRSAITRARIDVDRRKSILEKEIITHKKLLVSAFQDLSRSVKEKEIYELQLKSNSASYEAMKERNALGLTTPMDLVRSLMDVNLAELNLIRCNYQVLYYKFLIKLLAD